MLKILNSPKTINTFPPEKECIYITPPTVKAKAPIEAINGHGLGVTIWYGWCSTLSLFFIN
jgi:hypothetical protein